MRQLTLKSKPKSLTLREVYELYRMDTGTETPEFIIKVLDLCYPKLGRDDMDVFGKMDKYEQAVGAYKGFLNLIKGVVGNG